VGYHIFYIKSKSMRVPLDP